MEEVVKKRKPGRPPKVHTPPPEFTDDTVKDLVQKKDYKKPKLAEQRSVQLDPGDNTKFINNSLAMWDWEQPDMTDPVAVRQRVRDYFQLCADRDMKPNVPGFSFAFGIDRKTMWAWINGSAFNRKLSKEVIAELKRAYIVLNMQMEDYMQNGKINPVSGIFLMKNNMGYEDKTDVVVTPNNPVGALVSEDELRKRIEGDVVVDDAIEAEFTDG